MSQVINVNGEYIIVSDEVIVNSPLTVDGSLTVTGTAEINGDLTIQGTLTTISAEDLIIDDNLIVLNSGEQGAGVTGKPDSLGIAGIEIDRGTLPDPKFVWDEDIKGWTFELPDPNAGVLRAVGPFGNDEEAYLSRLSNPNDIPNKEYVDRSGAIDNVLFVQKSGSDSNSGLTWKLALATVEEAMSRVETIKEENPLAITLIEIGPGIYETEGHIDVPDDTFIRSMHRAAIFKPKAGFEERNVFRMGSGCFIEGPVFDGFQIDDLDDPTEGFAVCFRPGAIIRRTPYAHKIVVRNTPTWDTVAPPLDRNNQNPLVPHGGGVALADGSVCSPFSIYPNIMAWGATPVAHNGIGYCAKKGGLVNAINAVSIWAHIHFLAVDGGQLILSSCSNQFGDFSMKSKGFRRLVKPFEVSIPLTVQTADYNLIDPSAVREQIIDNSWNALSNTVNPATGEVYNFEWTADDEEFIRRKGSTLLQCIIWVLLTTNERPMLDFAKSLFNTDKEATLAFSEDKLAAFIFFFNSVRDEINGTSGFSSEGAAIVTALIEELNNTVTNPQKLLEPSLITSIGHTWSSIFAGVALTKVPPARNQGNILDSIIEEDQGIVIASGQDDQGSALFIGGMEIQADTGELSGPPFDRAVNRVATKAAIARSF